VAALQESGASSITFQIEPFLLRHSDAAAAAQDARALAADIRSRGMRVAVAVAPATPGEAVLPLVEAGAVDMVLFMSVSCGFGGQSFQPRVLDKVAAMRQAYPSLTIQMDGGINTTTARAAGAAGANAVVAGTAVFGAKEGPEAAIAAIRNALLEGLPGALARAHSGRGGGGAASEAVAGDGAKAAAV